MRKNICIFCHTEHDSDVCPVCGFSTYPKADIPGTLGYGTKLDIYTVGDVLTIDGESASYLAYDRENNRRVIIKEFLPVSMIGPRDGDNVVPQRGKEVLYKNLMMDFTDVYVTMLKIESEYVQKVYGILSQNNTAYAVLENVKGEPLKNNLIKRGKPYTYKEARWLFQSLFSLLKELENMNIAHGGISDETVVVTSEGNLVLTGFAIRDLRVKNEHVMYKLYDGFSAPEQYSTRKFAGLYTDIYSTAALFFNAVTGMLYSQDIFENPTVTKLFPKYGVTAIKKATKTSPDDRLNDIDDFVMLLDNKAIAVTQPINTVGGAVKTEADYKKYIPFIAGGIALLIFIFAILGLTSGGEDSSSLITEDSSYSEDLPVIYMVPEFREKPLTDILNNYELNEQFEFSVSYRFDDNTEKGTILDQSPRYGTALEKGGTIYLIVSEGKSTITTVPRGLAGMTYEHAAALLDSLGIKYATISVRQSEKYPYNTVNGSDKVAGTEIDTDKDTLILYVSDNTPLPSRSPEATPTPSQEPTPTPEQTEEPTPTPENTDEPSSTTEPVQEPVDEDNSQSE